jgi:Ig-like domain from next to BRCA1 gene
LNNADDHKRLHKTKNRILNTKDRRTVAMPLNKEQKKESQAPRRRLKGIANRRPEASRTNFLNPRRSDLWDANDGEWRKLCVFASHYPDLYKPILREAFPKEMETEYETLNKLKLSFVDGNHNYFKMSRDVVSRLSDRAVGLLSRFGLEMSMNPKDNMKAFSVDFENKNDWILITPFDRLVITEYGAKTNWDFIPFWKHNSVTKGIGYPLGSALPPNDRPSFAFLLRLGQQINRVVEKWANDSKTNSSSLLHNRWRDEFQSIIRDAKLTLAQAIEVARLSLCFMPLDVRGRTVAYFTSSRKDDESVSFEDEYAALLRTQWLSQQPLFVQSEWSRALRLLQSGGDSTNEQMELKGIPIEEDAGTDKRKEQLSRFAVACINTTTAFKDKTTIVDEIYKVFKLKRESPRPRSVTPSTRSASRGAVAAAGDTKENADRGVSLSPRASTTPAVRTPLPLAGTTLAAENKSTPTVGEGQLKKAELDAKIISEPPIGSFNPKARAQFEWTLKFTGTADLETGVRPALMQKTPLGTFALVGAPNTAVVNKNGASGTLKITLELDVESDPGRVMRYFQLVDHNSGKLFGPELQLLYKVLPFSGDTKTDVASSIVASTNALKMEIVSEDPPPGSVNVRPGDSLTKTWTLKNNGSVSWPSPCEVFYDPPMDAAFGSGAKITNPLAAVAPNKEVKLKFTSKVPQNQPPGKHVVYFQLYTPLPGDQPIGPKFAFAIDVVSPSSSSAVAAAASPSSATAKEPEAALEEDVPLSIPSSQKTFRVGDKIFKQWRVTNTGQIEWPLHCYLVFDDHSAPYNLGENFKFKTVRVPSAAPQQTVNVTVEFDAPNFETSIWLKCRLSTPNNVKFGPILELKVDITDLSASALSSSSSPTAPVVAPLLAARLFKDVPLDKSTYAEGEKIIKKWMVENKGTGDWPKNYNLYWVDQSTPRLDNGALTSATTETPPARPGQKVENKVTFTAPVVAQDTEVKLLFRLYPSDNPDARYFSDELWLECKIISSKASVPAASVPVAPTTAAKIQQSVAQSISQFGSNLLSSLANVVGGGPSEVAASSNAALPQPTASPAPIQSTAAPSASASAAAASSSSSGAAAAAADVKLPGGEGKANINQSLAVSDTLQNQIALNLAAGSRDPPFVPYYDLQSFKTAKSGNADQSTVLTFIQRLQKLLKDATAEDDDDEKLQSLKSVPGFEERSQYVMEVVAAAMKYFKVFNESKDFAWRTNLNTISKRDMKDRRADANDIQAGRITEFYFILCRVLTEQPETPETLTDEEKKRATTKKLTTLIKEAHDIVYTFYEAKVLGRAATGNASIQKVKLNLK